MTEATDYVENIEMQLAEVELLQSMYPGADEFKLNDQLMIEDLKHWLNSDSKSDSAPPTSISFVLKLENKMEMRVRFPHDYPGEKCAEIIVSSNELKRDLQSKLNKDLRDYLNETFEKYCAVTSVAVSWVQDNAEDYFPKQDVDNEVIENDDKSVEMGRLWLYSHHIYSKTKRKNILDLAKDHKLTGFCMPGKPGIVCLEGILGICNDVWSIIKQWNWKKINVKFQENEQTTPGDFQKLRKFDKFEEIGFVKGETRDYHMDMGEFKNYLQMHQCDYMFNELFGLDKS